MFLEEKFINAGSTFACSLCPAVLWRSIELSVHGVNFEGKKVLTSSAQLIRLTPGYCPNLPQSMGAPNCVVTPSVPGKWINLSKHTAGGKHLLVESSKFYCLLGHGMIQVKINGVKREAQGICKPFLLSAAGLKQQKEKQDADQKAPNQKTPAQGTTDGKKADALTNSSQKQNEKVQSIGMEDLYCPYDSAKEKCKSCDYVKANDTHMESSRPANSQILRKNYEAAYQSLQDTRKYYANPYGTVEAEYALFEKLGYGNAAHHILSTKDVFEREEKVKFVLKLANFYKYDVNEAYNCMILPGIDAYGERNKSEFHVTFSGMSETEKRAFKYDAMRSSKRQWHGGGHGHDFENDQNISCYATEVTKLLYNYMRNEDKNHCRAEPARYEKDRERFLKRLHKVIDLVREKLISFEKNYKSSSPYYVSADAYYFAFCAVNKRILVFKKTEEGIEAYKYAVNKGNGRTSAEERGRRTFDPESRPYAKRLVLFCEQITVAYFDEVNGKIQLPFSIEHRICINTGGLYQQGYKDYFENNLASVLAEIAEMECSRQGVLKERLEQIEAGGR